jgi:hypothetical protein
LRVGLLRRASARRPLGPAAVEQRDRRLHGEHRPDVAAGESTTSSPGELGSGILLCLRRPPTDAPRRFFHASSSPRAASARSTSACTAGSSEVAVAGPGAATIREEHRSCRRRSRRWPPAPRTVGCGRQHIRLDVRHLAFGAEAVEARGVACGLAFREDVGSSAVDRAGRELLFARLRRDELRERDAQIGTRAPGITSSARVALARRRAPTACISSRRRPVIGNGCATIVSAGHPATDSRSTVSRRLGQRLADSASAPDVSAGANRTRAGSRWTDEPAHRLR